MVMVSRFGQTVTNIQATSNLTFSTAMANTLSTPEIVTKVGGSEDINMAPAHKSGQRDVNWSVIGTEIV